MKETLQYAIEMLVCNGILWGLYRLLIRHHVSYSAERLYLIGSTLASIVIPMLQIPIWSTPIYTIPSDNSVIDTPTTLFHPLPATMNSTGSSLILLYGFYTAGALLLLINLLHQIWGIIRLRRSSGIEQIGDIKLIRHSKPLPPFSFLHTIYINRDTPSELLPAILMHEESHIRHHHSYERILIEGLKIFYWWNPFLWIAARDVEAVQEFEADHDVIVQGYRPAAYMEILFKQLFGYSPDIANGLRNSLIKKRLKMMTTERKSRYALLRLAATVPVTLTLLVAFGFTAKAAEEAPQQKEKSDMIFSQVDNTPQIEAPTPDEAPFKGNEVDVMPKFGNGGLDVFTNWVGSRLKYPDINVEGMVLAQFVIRSDGTLTDIEILRSPDQAFSQEVTRILSTSPRWTPGIKEGENGSVTFMLPIEFKSTEKRAK